MNELLEMIISLSSGLALGILFFGGLWFTLRKAFGLKFTGLWFLGSFIFRMGIVLITFYLIISSGNLRNGLLCLVGIVAARIFVISKAKSFDSKEKLLQQKMKEVSNEA